MRIGISAWGFNERKGACGTARTPDGHRYGRPILIDALISRGHSVLWLQDRREVEHYSGLIYVNPTVTHRMVNEGAPSSLLFPELDVLFVEHRWPTHKNTGSVPVEPDLLRQTELLQHYHGHIPVVIWDTDLKMTYEEELTWSQAIIADPTRETKFLARERVRLPFWTDNKVLFDASEYSYSYTYVGNNYERAEEFKRYYVATADSLRLRGIQTLVYGNWLERSPERSDPAMLIARSNNVAYAGRLSFWDSMAALNAAICVTHISKDEYYRLGFISPRYLESIACNVPALVPVSMSCRPLGSEWSVDSPSSVTSRVASLSLLQASQRRDVVNHQASILHSKTDNEMLVDHAVNFIESLT